METWQGGDVRILPAPGACGTHRKLLRADTKDLHHCTDGGPGSHSPSVEWDGHITRKHRLVSLVSKFEVHSGGWGGSKRQTASRNWDFKVGPW